jgi:hypothetical protein
MRIENPEEYKLLTFEKHNGNKKYNAILLHKKTGKIKKVSFGQKGYEHYHDVIGLYSKYDHNDKTRRKNYLARHANTKDYKFSSSWFSAKYLW